MKNSKKYKYFVFRVLIGLGFMLHGGHKLFGWFGGPGGGGAVDYTSLMGLAGVIELTGGLLIMVGLFTSIAALFGSFVMIGAWATMHIKQGINPLTNGGELAMIYFAAFLVLMAYGAGAYSLERMIYNKEHLHPKSK